ncbi:MAG: tetratricopeptide repeat protein [Prosthecobacter sp.]|uniref:tetratricopeptide repeat protein n=1 Tax=Prosthecobacter sp. TaxID=1965333 RepID=UPI0039000B0F
MSPDSAYADQLFQEALQRANQADRLAYLTAACGKDTTLWNAVWDRLQHDSRVISGARKTGSMKGRTVAVNTALANEKPNDIIGSYCLVKHLGEGGASVVWLAENVHNGKQAALKIMQTDARDFLDRFEPQLPHLKLLDHPGISTPLDCGTTPSGRPYILMELLNGVPITQFCDDQRLPLPVRVQFFLLACEALNHAHQKGVVHGGIKPGNVLLNWDDNNRPVLKIVDFGIAKALNHALANPDGILLAPPAYFSPEHARGEQIGLRSDIYAMGMLLYELLAGRLPLEKEMSGASLEGLIRCACDLVPLKPSACLQSLPKAQCAGIALGRQMEAAKLEFALEYQFDWIVMKALDKQPAGRHATLSALVSDLQHHLALSTDDELYRVGGPRPRKLLHDTLGILKLATLITLTLAGTFLVTSRFMGSQAEVKAQATAAKFREQHLRDLHEHGAAEQVAALNDAVAHLGELAEHPVAAAEVQEEIGLTYMALAETADAQTQFEGALEKRRLALGPEHPDTLRAMTEVGTAQHVEGQHAEAEKRLRSSLDAQRRVLGPEHPDTLVTVRVLAVVCEAENKPPDAETLFLELYQMQKRVLGPDHLDTLATLTDAARACTAQGKFEEAIKLREEQLAGMQRVHGARSPKTLVSMSITAATLEAGGKRAEAEQMFLTAMKGMQEVLGADHPETQAQMEALAAMHARHLQHDEAIKLRQQMVPLKQRLFGMAHPQTLRAMNLLAAEYEAAGKPDEALETQARILAILQDTNGPEHPDTLAHLEQMAQMHTRHGRHAEAVKLYAQVLAVKQGRLGTHAAQTHRAMHQLALAYDADGRVAEAEALELQTLTLTKAAFGPGDPDTLAQMRGVAEFFQRHDKSAEAENMYRQMLQIQQPALGPGHNDTLDTLSRLAATCQKQGRLQDADDLYFQVLNQRLQEAQPDQARVAAMLNLGACRLAAGKPDEAELLLREGIQLQTKHSAGHWLRFHAESLLGATKLAQKKHAEARTLLLASYEGLNARRDTLPADARGLLRDSIVRLVDACESTGSAEAAVWRRKLAEFDQTR